jgi:hypothetical protein
MEGILILGGVAILILVLANSGLGGGGGSGGCGGGCGGCGGGG